MSSILVGDPTQVTAPTATVSAATNASPIEITTSANHTYQTGHTVQVGGVGGNTAANGTWVIIVTSPTKFTLTGSVGNGAYTSGGTVWMQSLMPSGTIPSDGDTRDAASVNVMFELLAHFAQFLNLKAFKVTTFTSNGTFTAGKNSKFALAVGCGSGGGGGSGRLGGTNTNQYAAGGGGGGAAPLGWRLCAITPHTGYAVTIATGGAANSNGSSTTLGSVATFEGGGKGLSASDNPLSFRYKVWGGKTCANINAGVYIENAGTDTTDIGDVLSPGDGGWGGGGTNSLGTAGATQHGNAGGAAGTTAANSGSYQGGGGGGGGGAGPFGAGAAGGNGGTTDGTTGANGSSGSSAAANTGAGGGGGGGAGFGSGSGGTGGTAGSGGSGILYVIEFG
jgi:hypothetical protein